MLVLLKLLFAVLLLLNIAVFLLFIFWPADSVKQIHETLAEVNITERYFSGDRQIATVEKKSQSEILEDRDWRERSPKDLKIYLSERGVDLTTINSEQYLGELLGSEPSRPVSKVNLIRPEGRDLSETSLSNASMIIQSTQKTFVSKIESESSAPQKDEENQVSENSIFKMPNVTDTSDSGKISEEGIDDNQFAKSDFHSDISSSVNNDSFENSTQHDLTELSLQSNEASLDTTNQLIEINPVLENSEIELSTEQINSSLTSAVGILDTTTLKTQPPSKHTILTVKSSKKVHVSENNKVYELNALIYNPLELPQPESIFVECCDNSSIKVYLPTNLIENIDGTYLSQDHLELWFDRTSIKPRPGYGKISHQFGIGLHRDPWVIDFLQNDSDWQPKVSVVERGDILAVTIENMPPDLRAWNIVFSKAVKEGKNWVQGQLVSAVENFTWGNPDRLIPLEAGSLQNATQ